MARTNVDVDDAAVRVIMTRYGLSSKRDAINLALRMLAAEALSLEDALALQGSGWEGELDVMREARTP